MMKIAAIVVVVLLASCSASPTADDRSSVVAAVINDLYAHINQPVSAAAICQSKRADVPQSVLAKIEVGAIPAVQCSRLDPAKKPGPFHLRNSSKSAVVLAVDKVVFQSSTTATVDAHYAYAGLIAAGFVFTLKKTAHGWHITKKSQSWLS